MTVLGRPPRRAEAGQSPSVLERLECVFETERLPIFVQEIGCRQFTARRKDKQLGHGGLTPVFASDDRFELLHNPFAAHGVDPPPSEAEGNSPPPMREADDPKAFVSRRHGVTVSRLAADCGRIDTDEVILPSTLCSSPIWTRPVKVVDLVLAFRRTVWIVPA